MKIKPIEIDIENDPRGSVTTQIALYIDNPKVLKSILSLRKKWLKNKTFPEVSKHWAPPEEIFGLDEDILNLIRENQLPVNYHNVVWEAVVTGKVKSFSRTEYLRIPRKELERFIHFYYETQGPGDYEYALLTPLEATEEEIGKAFRELKKRVRESPEDFKPSCADTISNIRRDRKWYRLHQPKEKGGEGMSYYQIALKETKTQNREVVRKAIKQYENRLLQD